jgi:hypothetical protein
MGGATNDNESVVCRQVGRPGLGLQRGFFRGARRTLGLGRLAQTPRSKKCAAARKKKGGHSGRLKKNLGLLWILEIWISKTVTRYLF